MLINTNSRNKYGGDKLRCFNSSTVIYHGGPVITDVEPNVNTTLSAAMAIGHIVSGDTKRDTIELSSSGRLKSVVEWSLMTKMK